MWMEPPGTRATYPQRDQVVLKCRIEDSSFLLSQVFNVLLIVICTVYAIKTRKIPENFNESKFIGFTMYTTCIIWLAFLPIYFGTVNTNDSMVKASVFFLSRSSNWFFCFSIQIQITTMCLTISLSATVALVCLYLPKVYIIVFHPDKNVRKLTMNATYRRPVGQPLSSSTTRATGLSMRLSSSLRSWIASPKFKKKRSSSIIKISVS